MKKIVFLVSGGGGNLKFFDLAIEHLKLEGLCLSVIADRDCGAIGYSKKNDIPHKIIAYKRSDKLELQKALQETAPDLIVTNWHKIIDEDTVNQYAGKLVNLHYSLLPAFGGLIGTEPISQAYAQGCKFIGPTCHWVDVGVDTGAILAQAVFTTDRSMDESIQLMFQKGCLILFNTAMRLLHQDADRAPDLSDEFHPPLIYGEDLFDEEFWMRVATA